MPNKELTQNPFVFGTVVQGAQFIGRTTERRELITDIQNHVNLVLYGPRRYGKTSLVLQTFADLKKQDSKFIGLYIDFFKIHSREKFLQALSSEIARNTGWSMEKLLGYFRLLVRGVQPLITTDNEGKPVLQLSYQRSPSSTDLEEVLALLPDLAEKGYLVAVLLDEFQEIMRLNGNDFQQELRAVIQHHQEVSYIFCGSKEHLITRLFNQSDSPLYNIGKTRYVGKIPEQDFSGYLLNNMQEVQPGFNTNSADHIYQSADGIPHYVQMLAYEYYNLALMNREAGQEVLLNLTLKKLLIDRSEQFSLIYERLNPSWKKILEIILATDGEQVFRQEVTSSFRIATATLQKGLVGLRELGILSLENKQYMFQDAVFRRWLESYL